VLLGAQTYTVSGVVVNAVTNGPVAKATLSLALTSDRANSLYAAISDGDGRFSMDGVPAGRYSLTAQRNGYPVQRFEEHESLATALVLGPNRDATHLVFKMRPHTGLTVAVVDEENQPVRNARVRLFRRGVNNGESTVLSAGAGFTADTGRAHISRLQPGAYYAVASAQPWYAQTPVGRRMTFDSRGRPTPVDVPHSPLEVAYPQTWYGGSTDFAGAAPISLEMGTQPLVTIALQPVPAVRVRMPWASDAERQAGTSVQVFIEEPDGSMENVFSQQEHLDDALSVYGLAPGHYLFEIQRQVNFNPDQQRLAAVKMGRPPERSTLRVKADVTTDMTLPLSGSTATIVTGKVVGDGSLPREQMGLSLVPENPGTRASEISLYTDENSSFSSTRDQRYIVAGRYRLMLRAPGGALEVTSVAMNGQHARPGNLVTLGEGNTDLVVTLGERRTAPVTGIVIDRTGTANEDGGQPRMGVPVYLVPAGARPDTSATVQDQSDSDGTFQVNVRTGKYIALAIEDVYDLEYANPEALKPYLEAGVPFEALADKPVQIKVPVQAKNVARP
jgi:hypothetical protein